MAGVDNPAGPAWLPALLLVPLLPPRLPPPPLLGAEGGWANSTPNARTGGETHHVVARLHGRPTGRPEHGPPAKSPRDLGLQGLHIPSLSLGGTSSEQPSCSVSTAPPGGLRKLLPGYTVFEKELWNTTPRRRHRTKTMSLGPCSVLSTMLSTPHGLPHSGLTRAEPCWTAQGATQDSQCSRTWGGVPTCVQDPVNLH